MNLERLVIIAPSFFSYMEKIQKEFLRRKVDCIFFDERHSNSIISKIFYRYNLHFFIKKKREEYLRKVFKKILGFNTQNVLLIGVENIDRKFVNALKKNNIMCHLYMWDNLDNKKNAKKILKFVKTKSSFDHKDCKKYDMNYIPLFAIDAYRSIKDDIKIRRSIVFSGTLHSNRTKVLRKIEKLGITIEKKIYYHSKFLYIIKCFFNFYNFFYFRYTRFNKFSLDEITEFFKNSLFVLDIHHPRQNGLTMRTFEALRAGAWLITFNKQVYTLPESLVKRVFFVKNYSDILKIDFLSKKPTILTKKDDYFLSVERFIDNLIERINSA